MDERAAEELFRHKVLRLLRGRGLLSEERVELLLSWRRSGFSVHNRVFAHPGNRGEFEALVRSAEGETIDPEEFVARVLVQIPDPRRHLVHYYAAYSNRARDQRRKAGARVEGRASDGPADSCRRLGRVASASVAPLRGLGRPWAAPPEGHATPSGGGESCLFLVYNETRGGEGIASGFGPRDRSFTIKLSRLFDLLN